MSNYSQILLPDAVASSLYSADDKPSAFGLNYFMEAYENLSLQDIIQEVDGIVYVEEWKDINGYELVYQVSSFGRIKSFKRKHTQGVIILKGLPDKNNYLYIVLWDKNIPKHKKIHRLVGECFINNPENKTQINHRKGIKTDNRFFELEWATPKENQIHARNIGLINLNGEASPNSVLKNDDVLKIFNSNLSHNELAEIYNVVKGTISKIQTGLCWSHITGKKYKRTRIYKSETIIAELK